MNREIKFRIYNTTRSEFSYLELFNGKDANIHTSPDVQRSSNFKHPQQFTGLLDKNRKEIYEGDIVKDYYLKQIGRIKFGHPFSWGFTIRYFEDFNGEEINAFDSDDIAWAGLTMDSAKHYEVIGNIHENPELNER
jgi:uncharacterized phage protein (TIGR01671 family)